MATPLTVKSAVVAFCATVTVAGAATEAVPAASLARVTPPPPAGAGTVRVARTVTVFPTPTSGIPTNARLIAGGPAVAVKLTGVTPVTVAVAVWVAPLPRVQLDWARPCASVVEDTGVNEPVAVAHATVMFGTGLANWSLTCTTSGLASAALAEPAWLSPESLVTVAGGPARPVAVKVTGVRFATVAVSVLMPAAAPTVQLPTVAIPCELVVWVAPVTDPPPVATANVTVMFGTPVPVPSRTTTDGTCPTAVFTTAFWVSAEVAVTLAG